MLHDAPLVPEFSVDYRWVGTILSAPGGDGEWWGRGVLLFIIGGGRVPRALRCVGFLGSSVVPCQSCGWGCGGEGVVFSYSCRVPISAGGPPVVCYYIPSSGML